MTLIGLTACSYASIKVTCSDGYSAALETFALSSQILSFLQSKRSSNCGARFCKTCSPRVLLVPSFILNGFGEEALLNLSATSSDRGTVGLRRVSCSPSRVFCSSQFVL